MKDKIGDVFLDEIKGSIYNNRTRKYLTPILKFFGEELTIKLNTVTKVAIGISDKILLKSSISYNNHIFILCDTKIRDKAFESFLEYIKDFPYYTDDYVFGNIGKSKYHMIVIQVPERFEKTIDIFKSGKYSKLYSKNEIDIYFKPRTDIYKILCRDSSIVSTFTKVVNEEFNSDVSEDLILENPFCEFDLPPRQRDEIFNNHIK